jgi:hypothetical protein
MVNCMFDELSFQARLTSEWAYHRRYALGYAESVLY